MSTPVAGTAAVRFVADTSGLNAEIAKAVNPMAKSFGNKFGKALGPVLEQQKKHLDTFTTAAKYASLGAAGLAGVGFYSVVKAGAAFEKQMSVNSAVAEANAKQMVALEKQSIKLGQATFYSAKQAAEAQGELVKGGLSIKQILGGGLPAALSLAEAGELELATAAETTVNAMKLFGLSGKEAQSVANMLSTAANKTTADVGDFAEALKYGGSAAKLAGYNMNETVTSLEALAESGIKGSMAGTTFKDAIIELLKPSKEQAELQKKLGLELLTNNGHLKDAAELSVQFHRATDGMTQAERTKTLAMLGGQRGLIELNALVEKSPKLFEAYERANSKQGTAQEIAKKKMDNLAGAWEQFKGSLETAEIQIYKGIAPALKDLSEEGERVVNQIGKIFSDESLSGSEKFQRTLDVIGGELGKLWDEAEVPKHAAEAFAAAAPVVAEAAAHTAVFAAKEFGKAFIHAPFIAKAAMAAWLINFIGGKQAFVGIAKLYGKQFGLDFTKQAETSMAASAPGVVAESKAIAVASADAASSVPVVMPVARQSSFIGPGTGAARQAAVEASAVHDAEMATSYLGIPDMGAALQPQLAAEGKAGAKVFVKNLASDVRAGAPAVASSVASMGGRLAQGAATWGIGGFVVGQTVKEIGDSRTATTIGDAVQGAGIGAAIGTAIEPGIGTAIGAAVGGAGGVIASLFGSHEAQERGEKYGEEFLKGWAKNAPRLEKLAQNGFIGTPTRKEQLGTAAAQHGGRTDNAYAYYSGSGLKGERSTLEDRLQNTKLSKGQSSAIEAEIEAIDKAIHKIKNDRLEFKGVLSRMSGDALFGIGEINKDLTSGLAKADSAWGKGTKPWRKHTVEAMREAQQAIKEGMEAGVINTEAGQKKINALLRKIKLTSGKDPAGIAEGIADSFKEAGKVTDSGTKGLIKDLGAMPKGARAQGIKAIEEMTQGWAQGHPKLEKQVGLLTKKIETRFKGASQVAAQSQQHAMQQIIEANTGASSSVAAALTSIGGNLSAALKALGAKNLVEFKITQEASAFHHRQGGGPVPGTFTVPGSGSGDKVPMMLPPGSFIENREAARMPFQTGGMTPVVLEPKERVWLPPAVARAGAANLHARNAAFPRFQKGGETGTSIPHPMLSGPEPLRSGAQKGVDRTWKAAEKYLAAHSEPQRVLKMLRTAEHIASLGLPYTYGGGHGSLGVGTPGLDCSGFVSAILGAGNFIDSPMAVAKGSGLYTLGAAGDGKFFTWGVRGSSGESAHTMISLKAPGDKWKFFESGGSGGGPHVDSGWDGSFQHRHIPGFQKGGQLHGPPLFGGEGPPFYADALRHNQPWATHQAPWSTQLSKTEEASFLRWGKNIDGRGHGLSWFGFDPRRQKNDYDMRGFWKETGGVGPAANGHFTDKWKTPYDTTFSNESKYAKRGTPFVWTPNYKWLYDRRTGQEIISGQFQTGGEVPKKAKEAISQFGQEAFNPKSPHFVGWGYQRGGAIQKFAAGGQVVKGKVSWFNGGATAGGKNTGDPGIAVNLHPGTESGWNNSMTQGWMTKSKAGHPVVAAVQITGHKANLPIIDLGPAGFTQRAIDVTEGGVSKLGFSTSNFPTDAIGTATVGEAHQNAKEEKEHTYKEDVPANYGGVLCGNKPNFNMPKNLKAVEHEIDHWQKMLLRYRPAIRKARKENRPHIVQELQHREAEIASFLRELRNEKVKLRQAKAHKAFTKRIQRRFGNLFGKETDIEEAQHAYEKRNQFAEQVVDLEPLQPELPGEPEFPEQAKGESDKTYEDKRRAAHNAYEVQREAAEKAYSEKFTAYVEEQERPAFQNVLDSEADWRNTILGAEQFAAGGWQKQNFLGGFEGRFEDKVVSNVENQELIQARVRQITEEVKAWKDELGAKGISKKKKAALEERIRKAVDNREDLSHVKLPNLRFKEGELRKTIGEARELFYPGKAEGGHRGFELTTNPPAPAIGSGSFEEALKDVQGYYWPNLHEAIGSLPPTRTAGMFGGAIWDTQGAIEELGLKISQAAGSVQAASIEGPGVTGPDDSTNEKLELELELARNQLKRDAIEKSLGPVLKQFETSYPVMPPYAGKAHTGAVVPGPPNAEKTMILQGRETIFTEDQTKALGGLVRAGSGGPGVPISIEQLILHQDGTATARHEGREFEVAVEDVVHKTNRPLVTSGAGRAFR